MRRGRPRHDDVLTPREWQVLDLLRQGLTNEQIATRLSISAETAKFHVSEILGKLGLSSRQEAARWQGEPKQRLGGWWAFGRGSQHPPASSTGSGAAAALLVLLVVVFLGVLLLTRTRSGNEASTGADVPPGVDGEPSAASSPQALAPPRELPISVCFDDETWQKPSREEQERYMTTDYRPARYGVESGLTGRIEEAYLARFWGFGFSASGLFSMIDMSGLWTARDAGLDLRNVYTGPCQPGAGRSVARVNLWLLGYAASAATLDAAGKLTVRVGPKQAGFQVVQILVEGATDCCPAKSIEFVDPAGVHIETMVEIWSKP
jgi:DNA-binding CsgD family transcriptional regulator